MLSGIYWILNTINNKIYIGSSKDLYIRKRKHFERLKKGNHTNNHLQNAYNKYGKETFEFEILITCDPTLLLWYEQQFIDQCKPEYNILSRAYSNIGYHHSDEAKKKISLASKRMKRDPLSDEHKNRLRTLRLGIKSAPIPDEIKMKISKTLEGHIVPELTRQKISVALKGHKLSPESIKKRTEARKGYKHSDETKKKQSDAVKLSWQKRKESEL